MVNVLVIGSGGREHALAWKLAQSPQVDQVFVAPGNGGTATEAKCQNLPIHANDLEALLEAVKTHEIVLTVIGPEAPLVAGLADDLRDHGHLVFGPGRAGAQMEGSKEWSKAFLIEHDIPTPHAFFCKNFPAALTIIYAAQSYPIVIKADGLAGGKGVFICDNEEDAVSCARSLLLGRSLKSAGATILVEDFLEGEEVSLHVLIDGETAVSLLPARDYKRRDDGDQGPNTGGMGAYAPVDDRDWHNNVMADIVGPTLRGLREWGMPYRGVLYIGLMLTSDGPKVLEFNCRFGDPETQVILPLLKSDFYELCLATAKGELGSLPTIEWEKGWCVGVVLASRGYPDAYETGMLIIEKPELRPLGAYLFHAGTTWAHGTLQTSGGRVMTAMGVGSSKSVAQHFAYGAAASVYFPGMVYREDIAE